MTLQLVNRELTVPRAELGDNPAEGLRAFCLRGLRPHEVPIRFVVSRSDARILECEFATLRADEPVAGLDPGALFDVRPRRCRREGAFRAVFVVPTGIGAQLGGHAGDAGAAVRLLAAACDSLITHPNAVNASDINETPDNALYVEGSVLTRVLAGTAGLRPVRANRVLLIADDHPDPEITALSVNAASAARVTLGLDIPAVVALGPSFSMRPAFSASGSAVGTVDHLERFCEAFEHFRGQFDAVAVASVINIPWELHLQYLEAKGDMVNPWGGVEAMLTHAISMMYNVPTAHSPMMEAREALLSFNGIVDPRMAAEEISSAFLHCVLKGLHRAPRIVTDPDEFRDPEVITAADIDALVLPDGCLGIATLAAFAQGIPVIAVRENRNCMRNDLAEWVGTTGRLHTVDNYLEAAGLLTALRAGVAPETVRRPLPDTRLIRFPGT